MITKAVKQRHVINICIMVSHTPFRVSQAPVKPLKKGLRRKTHVSPGESRPTKSQIEQTTIIYQGAKDIHTIMVDSSSTFIGIIQNIVKITYTEEGEAAIIIHKICNQRPYGGGLTVAAFICSTLITTLYNANDLHLINLFIYVNIISPFSNPCAAGLLVIRCCLNHA